jgi:hypothetical protein
VKRFKLALLIILGSPLIWLGAGSALGGFLTEWILWSGYLNPMARVADALGIGFALNALFIPSIIVTGVCFFVCGIILGLVRLCRQPHKKSKEDGKPIGTESQVETDGSSPTNHSQT